jgi:hypothetical protein
MNICTPEGAFNGGDIEFDTLAEAKAFACKQSDQWAAHLRDRFLNPISPYEASSWPLKMAEAIAYPNCPALTIEAQARGVTLEALVAKITSKAQQLAYLEAIIAGMNGRHNDAIKALTTIEEVCAYDWRFEV